METEFDIVVYGATGFTGRLAAAYLCQAKPGLKVALAGRSAEKLAQVAAKCAGNPAIIVADSADQSSIAAMVKRSGVVANFAGPFSLYAEPVIAACTAQGRHYCDITGETPFIKKMIRQYHSSAVSSGACLVPFAGFDSVPAELCTYLALKAAAEGAYTLDHMVHYYQMRAGLNGGTLASALTMAEQKSGRDLYNPNVLINDPKWPKSPLPSMSPRYEPLLKRWAGPFIMGAVNTAVVRRSTYLRQQTAAGEKPFVYEERQLFGGDLKGRLQAQAATLALGAVAGVTASSLGRRLARKFGPQPGQGQSDEQRQRNFYKGRLIAHSQGQAKLLVTMECQGDPGNELTISFASEIAILLHQGAQQKISGFTTPSVAFAEPLLERLQKPELAMRFETKTL